MLKKPEYIPFGPRIESPGVRVDSRVLQGLSSTQMGDSQFPEALASPPQAVPMFPLSPFFTQLVPRPKTRNVLPRAPSAPWWWEGPSPPSLSLSVTRGQE